MSMLKFKPGDTVRQKLPKPIEGPVLSATIVDNDHVQYEVGIEGGGSRFFRDDDLEDEAVATALNDEPPAEQA